MSEINQNLKIWEAHADIDPKFTKAITGKQYKGTSPNPHYVIRCLTEQFGPVGKGFGWEVVADDFLPLGDEILHWCRIRFWHTDRENFFEAYGQTKALMKTKNGFMSDEDAPKKSLTDAITKAASQIGIGANIFLGRWDDSKYVDQVNADFRQKEQDETAPDVTRIEAASTGAELLNVVMAIPEQDREHEAVLGAVAVTLRRIIKSATIPALGILEKKFPPVWPMVRSDADARRIELQEAPKPETDFDTSEYSEGATQ